MAIKTRPPTTWKNLPVIMDSELVSIVLGLSEVQIRTLAREGKIPAFKVGNQWRFEKRALMQLAGSEGDTNE